MRFPLFLGLALAACGGGGGHGDSAGADLSGFRVTDLTVGGVRFEVYLAETPAQHAQGLMFATSEQVAPLRDGTPRGMLFVFASESLLSFFMRNTFLPLDLAYATDDGTIVELHDLVPLDETPVTSGQPARFALEVLDGTFAAHGIGIGATIVMGRP